MDGGAGGGAKVGDVFVAVVEVVGNFAGCWEKDERTGGNGFGGIPHVGVEKHVVGATELLDAEVVVVDEALEGFCAIFHRTHLHAAAHAVKGHRDHGVALRPTDGTVLCVVDNRPNAGLGLDEGLVSVSVILWREIVDGGILVEVVGGVGLALGSGTISDIIVGIKSVIRGDQLIAGVVTILLVILRSAAAKEIICVDIRTNLCTIGVISKSRLVS